jgi:hypothetical protein
VRTGEVHVAFESSALLKEHVKVLRVIFRGELFAFAARFSGYDFEQEKDYSYTALWVIRARTGGGPGLDSGFGNLAAFRVKHGRFAWVTTAERDGGCPCTLRASNRSGSFVVARRDRPVDYLHFDGSAVDFESGAGPEHAEVPFSGRPRRFDPLFGGTDARFRLEVPLPDGVPTDGRMESFFYDVQNWGHCHTWFDPHNTTSVEGRTMTIEYFRVHGREWCRGTHRVKLIYRWGGYEEYTGAQDVGSCGPGEYNCAGEVRVGHVALHVRRDSDG